MERVHETETLTLQPLSLSDGEAVYEMLQGIGKNENGFHNQVKGISYDGFRAWLKQEYAYDHGIGMPDWMVPQTTYWLMADDIPVGCGRLRHELNDSLREGSGHIGYAIAEPYRGRGYGRRILALLMEEAWKLGIRQLQVSANTDNERSNRVIRANGGVLYRESNCKNFYYIDLKNLMLRESFAERVCPLYGEINKKGM